jgi:S-adenosylmethionine decarboxylase
MMTDQTTATAFVVRKDGVCYAGTHLLIDLWGAENLDDLEAVDLALRRSVEACGATLLDIYLHRFTPNGGVSGVAVLAESHISIHTWPERGYAALDVFVCGVCDPYEAIPVLREAFRPERVQLTEQKRGLMT